MGGRGSGVCIFTGFEVRPGGMCLAGLGSLAGSILYMFYIVLVIRHGRHAYASRAGAVFSPQSGIHGAGTIEDVLEAVCMYIRMQSIFYGCV